jgi:hypothetical protein
MHRFARILVACALLVFAAESAVAQVVQRQGQISLLLADNSPGANFDYRLYLSNLTDLSGNPVSTLCSATAGANFVYVNATDRNYRSMVTAMSLAKALNVQVAVTVEALAVSGGTYCHLLDLWW